MIHQLQIPRKRSDQSIMEHQKELQETFLETAKETEDKTDIQDIKDERGDYHNLVDILFVIDTTGSMGWCIKECKNTIKKIIKKFSQKQYNIKFALQLYRDHPPQEFSYVEKHHDLMSEDKIIKVLDQKCDVAGGGDIPEAVMDGLFQGIKKTSWRIGTDGTTKSKRFLFHCCDAPPHGNEYSSTDSSKEWAKNGCPCGLTRLDVQGLLFENSVDYSLIKTKVQHLELMESLFKECFGTRFKRVMEIEAKEQNSPRFQRKEVRGGHHSPRYETMGSGDEDFSCIYNEGSQEYNYDKERKVSLDYSGCQDSEEDMCEEENQTEEIDQFSKKIPRPQCKKRAKKSKGEFSSKMSAQRSMASLVCSEVESGLSDYEKQLEIVKEKPFPIEEK